MGNPTKERGDEPRCSWRVALPVSYKTSTVLVILSSPVKILFVMEERTNLRENWNYEWEMRGRSVMIASCHNKMLGFLASCVAYWVLCRQQIIIYIYSGDPSGSLDNRSNPIKIQHKIALRNTADMSILISYRCPLSRPPSRKYWI
jgi:hypothetical protein